MFIPVVLLYMFIIEPLIHKYIGDIPKIFETIIILSLLILSSLDFRTEQAHQKAKWFENKFLKKDISKIKLLVISIIVFCFSLLIWGLSLYVSIIPSKENLEFFEGSIEKITYGGLASPEFLYLKQNGELVKFRFKYTTDRESRERLKSNIEEIKAGDYVEILADKTIFGSNDDELYHYWIWQIIKGDKIILSYDEVKSFSEKKDKEFRTFADKIMLFSSILLAFAFIRHLVKKKS
jgi:hypothetical protein